MPNQNSNQLERFLNGIGAFTELSVLYFQSCRKAGASMEEASAMTKIFMELIIQDINNGFGGTGN